jgi:hypothetical protein
MMNKPLCIALCCCGSLLLAAVAAAEPASENQAAKATAQPDALDEALALAGLQRADLGWEPKGWWPRFPADIPYKLRAFDSLFAEPLDCIAYTRSLAAAARDHLDPAKIDKPGERGTTPLYHAVHRLGINPRFGGLRGYTTNLTAPLTPLDEAILQIYRANHRTTEAYTFAMELPYPKPQENLTRALAEMPAAVQPILGQLLVNIIDAHRWAELAFRNVDGNQRVAVTRRLDLGEEQVDAYDYCPALDDVAATWDEASLWYAAEKCVQALDDARIALAALDLTNVPTFAFDWETPWGWILIRGGGDDVINGADTLLVVDLGGNDTYRGPVAASDGGQRISLCLDLGGDDYYEATGPAQGAGLAGIGVLIDAAGRDRYRAERYGQGVGQFGFGLCADLGGDDQYDTKFTGQGCGYFGVGLLLDVDGDDAYTLWADGQGLGGEGGGVGVLADRRGSDRYTAVRDAKLTGRPSYHSPNLYITVSNAQGCAMGRRGDGADGHSYAGGLGALLDTEGDDHYVCGNWTLGTGYWFGMGAFHDAAGDDEYHSVCYSQASGAHFCIGVFIDETGDDLHVAEVNSNMCIGWGHDFTIALFVEGDGDDRYEVHENGLSYSINRSVTAVFDLGGSDEYIGAAGHRPGMAQADKRFEARGGVSDYFADTTSLALFLDVGGTDRYLTWEPPADTNQDDDAARGEVKEADAAREPAPFGGGDNTHWLDEPGSMNLQTRNFSIGVDRPDGAVSFRPRPVRTPSGPAQPATRK